MANSFNVTIAEAALWSLQDAESFKSNYTDSVQAALWADDLLASSIKAISQDPDRYRYNAMLADKGISIRERLDPDNQYRCLYDFDEQMVSLRSCFLLALSKILRKCFTDILLLNRC